MNKKKIYFLGALSGVLLAISFPPMPFYLLSFISLAPLLLALEEKKEKSFLLIYMTFFIYCAGSNWWIGSWQEKTDVFLIYAAFVVAFLHPLFFLLPIYVYKYFRKKFSLNAALLIFPFIWVSWEWLKSFSDLAYTWLTLGQTQIYNHYWVQAADIGGIWGLSLLIAFANVFIVKIIIKLRNNKGESLKDIFKIKRLVFYCIWAALIIIGPIVYGMFRVSQFEHEELLKERPVINAAVVQPNIDPWAKWENFSPVQQIALYQNTVDSLLNATDAKIDLAVWAETAITNISYNINYKHDFGFLENWLQMRGLALLSGFVDRKEYDSGGDIPLYAKPYPGDSSRFYSSFNSAVLLQPLQDTIPQIYHKIKLTPFSEKFPFIEIFSFARDWFEWGVGISSWTPGENQENLSLVAGSGEVSLSPIICIESIYPYYVRNFVNRGAGVLTVITNDSWFDHTPGPRQHYLIAAMRAVENRRYIIRAANSGISGFISPTGESILELEPYETSAAAISIPVMETKSLYYIFGDFVAIISTVIVLITFFYAAFYKFLTKNAE